MRRLSIAAALAAAVLPLCAAEKGMDRAAPTYAREVSRIIQNNCERCHRPGQIGPFSLTGYEQSSAYAREIKRVTQAHIMPPWHAVKGYGEFKNERRLSDADVDTLARWADAGAPLGDTKDLPTPVKYSDDWLLGTPDAVLASEVAYAIDASGEDEYRCFVLPTSFAEDRTIQAIEVRPGSRKIVHHVLLYSDVSGKGRHLDAADPKPGFSCWGGLGFFPQTGLGGWAPGSIPMKLPDDTGRYLAKGADVIMQVHYHKNGKADSDRTSLGLYFNRERATKFIRSRPVANIGIRIPADDSNYRAEAHWTVPEDILGYSVAPHMHLLGKEMLATATFPDGTKKDLVWAKPYSFNWQTAYVFKEPIPFPKGTRIDVTAYYDNSEKNPNNPNKPLREVRWGEATTDEMLIGWIAYISDKPIPTGRW
jgi:hypothetical protein